MIRAYSQRILPPYSGVVQIAQSERARAQSFDGVSWEIHYTSGVGNFGDDRNQQQGYALDTGYYRVASWESGELRPYIVPACLDSAEVAECIAELSDFLSTAEVPFPAADIYEYWLLDGADASPLALIFSCCEESQMAGYPSRPEWTALPHSKLKIDNTAGEQARNEPPVNHRFQHLVQKRAGVDPQAAWFKRVSGDQDNFPGCLVREDWSHESDHDLCQRYLLRKAPRLLMLHGLSSDDRERLEIAARPHVFEVDDYFPLYPEINDMDRMSAMRVEARLRRATPQRQRPADSDKTSEPAPMSKDMRIFDT